MDPALHQPLGDTLASVPVVSSLRYGPLSCRSWVKAALEALDDLGFIKLIKPLNLIESELVEEAERLRTFNARAAEKNSGSAA